MRRNIKRNTQHENKLVTAIGDQAGQHPATGILLAEPERFYVEDTSEMTEDGFEEDSVAYTTEWESDKEDAVSPHHFAQGVVPHLYFLGHQELEARLTKWVKCNDARWADLMRRIQSSEQGASKVPPSPQSTGVIRDEVVEKYDDDFDVDSDLPCMKVRATHRSFDGLNTFVF